MRKYEALDLMKLKALGSANGWNTMLTDCHNKLDINRLSKIRYQLQAGMDDLVKLKMNSEEMILWYVRLNKSLEITAKRIIKIKHPLPQDNPLIAKSFAQLNETKRRRDIALMTFLKSSSY